MAAEMMDLEADRVVNEMQIMLQQAQQDQVEDNVQRVLATGV
jgi:hypothetical protein